MTSPFTVFEEVFKTLYWPRRGWAGPCQYHTANIDLPGDETISQGVQTPTTCCWSVKTKLTGRKCLLCCVIRQNTDHFRCDTQLDYLLWSRRSLPLSHCHTVTLSHRHTVTLSHSHTVTGVGATTSLPGTHHHMLVWRGGARTGHVSATDS